MKTTRKLWSYRSKETEKMDATNCELDALPLRAPAASAALVLCALLGTGSAPCLAGASSQTTFPTPDEAGRALVSAVQQHDEKSTARIVGGGDELVSADDQTEERLEQERFVQKYQEMHRWVRESGGTRVLYIGAENWPFPIPLVSVNGQWRFDSKAGTDEILFRRIGENEVTAIGMCDTLAAADTHPGTDSEAYHLAATPLSELRNSGNPIPFHGYYFHILPSAEGGFAAIAYPVMYRSSGVKTFVVTLDGGVSEKDLGHDTAKIAAAMTTSRIDSTWTPVESKP
jgi:Protein of unknown function (DUF2950)